MFSWESLHSIAVGGVAVHVTELAAALERRGHEVHVFTRRGQHQSHYDRIHGVHYHLCTFEHAPNFFEEISNMCNSFVNSLFAVEDLVGDFNIVHMHDWLTSNAIESLKGGKNRKTVITMHSTEYGRNGNQFLGDQAVCIQEQERLATHSVDKIVAVSQHLKKEICWLYQIPASGIDVIHNGVNIRQFEYDFDIVAVRRWYQIGENDQMVLFVGRIVTQKGPDILMYAIPLVLKYFPSAKFVFAGDGDMRSDIAEIAEHSGIAHAVRLVGDRRGREIQDLLRACDILAVPSRNEPFGIAILEGWSAGKPVLITRNGGLTQFVSDGENGLVVDANPESVGEGLVRLLAAPESIRDMGNNGRATVRSAAFSWDTIAQKTALTYQTI